MCYMKCLLRQCCCGSIVLDIDRGKLPLIIESVVGSLQFIVGQNTEYSVSGIFVFSAIFLIGRRRTAVEQCLCGADPSNDVRGEKMFINVQ